MWGGGKAEVWRGWGRGGGGAGVGRGGSAVRMQVEPDLKITRRAGRLTPAAKVEVAHSTEIAPVL